MSQRGHVLLLAMCILAAFVLATGLFAAAVQTRIDGRADEEVRLQALWLARSALDAGVTGTRTVATPAGEARVTASAGRVEVGLAGARPTATGDPATERFERPAD